MDFTRVVRVSVVNPAGTQLDSFDFEDFTFEEVQSSLFRMYNGVLQGVTTSTTIVEGRALLSGTMRYRLSALASFEYDYARRRLEEEEELRRRRLEEEEELRRRRLEEEEELRVRERTLRERLLVVKEEDIELKERQLHDRKTKVARANQIWNSPDDTADSKAPTDYKTFSLKPDSSVREADPSVKETLLPGGGRGSEDSSVDATRGSEGTMETVDTADTLPLSDEEEEAMEEEGSRRLRWQGLDSLTGNTMTATAPLRPTVHVAVGAPGRVRRTAPVPSHAVVLEEEVAHLAVANVVEEEEHTDTPAAADVKSSK